MKKLTRSQYKKNLLTYPNKRSALTYLLRRPSLALSALFSKPSYFCLNRLLKKIAGTNMSSEAWNHISDNVLRWASQNGLKDPTGELRLLYLIVKQCEPSVFVETGVAHGSSSSFILQAMRENNKGHLHSIDIPPKEVPADVATTSKGRIHTMTDGQKHRITDCYQVGDKIPEDLKNRWSITLGDAKEKLPQLLKDLGSISVFWHDSLHTYEHMMFEYETAWPYIEKGGLLLSHDILWNKALLDFSKKVGSTFYVYRNIGCIKKI